LNKQGFCTIRTVPYYAMSSRAVSVRGKTWDVGDTIHIVTLNGSKKQHLRLNKAIRDVLRTANLNYTFNKVSIRDSDIRVRFGNGGNWSYLGTDALMQPQNKPTMNLQDNDIGTYRHEVCHALGAMAHEHQSPNAEFEWNEEKVIEDLKGPPNFWSVGQIRHNVLNRYRGNQVRSTKFDSNSIMLYFFPDRWVKGGKGTRANSTLSKLDRELLARLYPSFDRTPKKSFFSRVKELFA